MPCHTISNRVRIRPGLSKRFSRDQASRTYRTNAVPVCFDRVPRMASSESWLSPCHRLSPWIAQCRPGSASFSPSRQASDFARRTVWPGLRALHRIATKLHNGALQQTAANCSLRTVQAVDRKRPPAMDMQSDVGWKHRKHLLESLARWLFLYRRATASVDSRSTELASSLAFERPRPQTFLGGNISEPPKLRQPRRSRVGRAASSEPRAAVGKEPGARFSSHARTVNDILPLAVSWSA